MRIHFHGAARSVTGSMHILEVGDQRVLLECGMYQGKRKEATKRNRELPFDPKGIHAATLSHAHIDHSGNLPNLVKNGYGGSILATSGTADVARVLLRDSAMIQARDAEYLNRKIDKKNKKHKGKPKGKKHEPVEPIYTIDDAIETGNRFQEVPYHEAVEVAPGVRLTFHDAGHILGSAVSLYELTEGDRTIRLGFTGDLGRPRQPILRDPEALPAIDYLITESTYGDRVHDSDESMKDQLHRIMAETIERGGRLVIPAFSVGRTQNLVYYLAELFHEGRLQPIKIFVDSPLAVNATKAYRDHPECFDLETQAMLESGQNPFGFELLTYTRSREESMEINSYDKPCVVISASGMCEGGRILHHLKRGVSQVENTLLIVGYQAEHTLGRRILDGEEVVPILGKDFKVRCQVKKMNGLSAHADREEMSTYIKHIPGLKQVFVVHGEETASLAFAEHLEGLGLKAHVPTLGESVEL
jgi:metallo-beta-lactamase family protein